MRTPRHPLANNFRVVCSSGSINGRPPVLQPIEKHVMTGTGDRRRSPDFAEKCRQASLRAWLRRKNNVRV